MILQSFRMALKSILTNKMRSFLTMLGIIIGVLAVVVLVGIAEGTSSEVTSSIESLGTHLLTVNIRSPRNELTLSDLRTLTENDSVTAVAPVLTQSVTVKAGDVSYDEGSIIGTVPEYAQIRDQQVQSGRFLTNPDLDNRSYVAVIGSEVAMELFGTQKVVGEIMSIGGMNYTIVGVLEEQGSSLSGSGDNQIVIPFTLAQRLYNAASIQTFYAAASPSEEIELAEYVIGDYLDANLGSGDSDEKYTIYSQSEMLETLTDTTQTLALMLGGIAGISLLVGGIGIMNIMLVSVTERTREIGIRKAIGASRGNILLQFLVEALVVSVMGALIGLLLSVAAGSLLSGWLSIRIDISPAMALFAIGFSVVVGLIFGLYPANKASRLRPIEALRYGG